MQKKKSLGQYFLNSPQTINNIVKASGTQKGDVVLEIGPGKGVLTSALLEIGANVTSVEKDDRLIPVLEEKFSKEIKSGRLNLVHADILKWGMDKIKQPYKMVANIPYYITGQIIRMFLESDHQPKSMTLLVQKEVAERIVTKDGKESLLSLSVKVFGTPKYIKTVGRGAFSPQPNVDSAILFINNISRLRLDAITNIDNIANNKDKSSARRSLADAGEKMFFEIIHAGFAHKRKQLLPNLQNMATPNSLRTPGVRKLEKEMIVKIFEKCGIDKKIRAEDVSLETWVRLCGHLISTK